jgi:ribose-phosphate pyrophosphokinase
VTEVHWFAEDERLGRALTRRLRAPGHRIGEHRFPDGELLTRVRHRGARHAVLVRSLHDPDAKLVAVRLAADALRRAGARRLTLVAPYLPYMRQDTVFRDGEPISQRVIGDLLGSAFDGVLTLEAHLHRTARLGDVFPCAARSLPAVPLLVRWLRRRRLRPLLVGPDAESHAWVRALARAARLPYVVGAKRRLGDANVRVSLGPLPVARSAVIVDDIASSGATLAATARALQRAGIGRVEAVVVHAIFARGAEARMRRANIARVVSTDSVPHRSNAIACLDVFAAALRAPR